MEGGYWGKGAFVIAGKPPKGAKYAKGQGSISKEGVENVLSKADLSSTLP